MNKNNKFLSQLLNLAVSGRDAIIGPGNWLKKPLLNIETDVDKKIKKVAKSLIRETSTDKTGVWWFLIGSPGNGKSAAVGSLVRDLRDNYGSEFREPKDDRGKGLGRAIDELREGDLPYLMELYEKDNSYPSALFAQDASVVPKPWSKNPDPGDALIDLLKRAYKKGQSVVVCANRGIIERALQQKVDKSDRWYLSLIHI